MSEWQPIETAPIGKLVLVIDRFNEKHVAVLNESNDARQWMTQHFTWLYSVTHWMELPPAPAERGQP